MSLHKAIVVETNDPLNMGRVRIRIPALHDEEIPKDRLPWALYRSSLGGRNASEFISACIGDIIWVEYESGDHWSPVWSGFANPTRRGFYAYQQIHKTPPPPMDREGQDLPLVQGWENDLLPLDGRPYSVGVVDPYGNTRMSSYVGYFPSEHDEMPIPSDLDSNIGYTRPLPNNPDMKFMLDMSKYGHISLKSDIGYVWKKEGEFGEFVGDVDADAQYEATRWREIQKYINNGSVDQRRTLEMTRYGHRLTMSDVGWAQPGPIESKSRNGEFGEPRYLSKETSEDARYVCLATKGGMLFIASDIGLDPSRDSLVDKKNNDDLAEFDQKMRQWSGRDGRFTGMMTRYGIKFILDDRGSRNYDPADAPDEYGLGWMLKGRRKPGTYNATSLGENTGFYFQVMEHEEANNMMLGSPNGSIMEINDKYQYMALASSMGIDWASKSHDITEHEYVMLPAIAVDFENNSHHLKIDHHNEYIRLKTRSGRGTPPINSENTSTLSPNDTQQGLEIHDGNKGDGEWVELVDCEGRGYWLSKKEQLSVFRSRNGRSSYIWFDDETGNMAIYNGNGGSQTDIFSTGNINIKSDSNINMNCSGVFNLRVGEFRLQTNGGRMTFNENVQITGDMFARQFGGFFRGCFPGPGAGVPQNGGSPVEQIVTPIVPQKIEPSDRAQTYNGPFTGVANI